MSTPNTPTRGSTRTRPAERDWFGDAIKHFDAPPEDDRTQAVAEAAGIWIGYALFGEAIECLTDATDDEKYKLWNDLNYAHHKATEFLMKEAERAGLNAAPLAEAKRICQELFKQVRGQGPASNPYSVKWFHHPKCTSDTWPDCLGEWRYALPPAMQEAIRQGEEVFTRLMVRLSITPAVNPHIRPAIEQGDGTQIDEEEELLPDPFAGLLEFARTKLKGQERAVIEALCDAGGELPIADLAVLDGVGWDDPFQGFKDAQRRLNPKLKPEGWRLERRNNAGFLVTF
jgi:hypothetical protein